MMEVRHAAIENLVSFGRSSILGHMSGKKGEKNLLRFVHDAMLGPLEVLIYVELVVVAQLSLYGLPFFSTCSLPICHINYAGTLFFVVCFE